jgi:hypothetical protein
MGESLSDWLALREAADASARSTALTSAVAERLGRENPVRVLDLGTGTGSNLRYLLPHLGANQHWVVVDHDADVLSNLRPRMSKWAAEQGYEITSDARGLTVLGRGIVCVVEIRRVNLSTPDDAAIFSDRHLVTASALLDLVSDGWIRSLAARCREHDALVLFALTYDGRSRCSPTEPQDDMIRDLVNGHQKQRETGAGRAAGPDAPQSATTALAAVGYEVRQHMSDWVLPANARAMQRELLRGWAGAALEIAPERTASIQDWLARRLAHVDDVQSTITVGHRDLAAWR